jgi:hypothetical protein
MPSILPTNLMILGTIDSLLDMMKMTENRVETRDALVSAILSRFFSAMLEDESFAMYIREVAPRLQGNTDPEAVLKAANDHLAEKGRIDLDVVPLFRSQAQAVLTEFVLASESDASKEELTAIVDAALG